MLEQLKQNKGFTMFELMIVIIIFAFIFSMTSIVFGDLISKHSLASETQKAVQVMREIRMNSVAQKDDSKWGINLVTSTDPDRYIMFKGNSYASRDPAADIVFILPAKIFITNISLGGGNEVVFENRSGYTNNAGSFSFSNEDKQIDLTVNDLGLVDYYQYD